MKTLLLIATFIISYTSFGQYYYKDIIGVKETEQMIKAYRNNKVNTVVLKSFDADGTKNEDFAVEQHFNPTLQVLTTNTSSGVTDASVLTTYVNAEGKVIKTTDSTDNTFTTTTYNYNSNGLLNSVVTYATDTTKSMAETEEHIWVYNNTMVEKMWRIKNKKDTLTVHFKLDANGNPVEEQSVRPNQKPDIVYYYYDAKNRLTDIVRYNARARRLLPEYMFEYSPADKVIQRITIPANSSDYLIWRFQYNDKGLRTKEAVYNKQKKLNGTIEYQYGFGSL